MTYVEINSPDLAATDAFMVCTPTTATPEPG
jgi:hypothetical protein